MPVSRKKYIAGKLNNLKELDLDGNISILRQVVFPKLEKLTLRRSLWLRPEDFVALSRSAKSLQHIESKNPNTNFLPAIIDSLPALNTLSVISLSDGEDNQFRPSRQNQSLEELVIWMPMHFAPVGVVIDVINACTNLKRIQLYGVPLRDVQVLEVIRNSSQLTHFWFGATFFDLFKKRSNEGSLDPVLMSIIDIFLGSSHFISLSLWGIVDQKVEEYLSHDADRILVSKFSKTQFKTCLKLTKKSVFDSFEEFEKKADSYFEPKSFARVFD